MMVSVWQLQSYILSTTTETYCNDGKNPRGYGFNRTSFQQQLKLGWSNVGISSFCELQSYILSTTTETLVVTVPRDTKRCFNRTSFQQQLKRYGVNRHRSRCFRFNRTSFQQQLKRMNLFTASAIAEASIVHPFNNN